MKDINIRIANIYDFEILKLYDMHIEPYILLNQLKDNKIFIIEQNKNFVGWLRYNLFWDSIPFLNMLFIIEQYQKKGYGTLLLTTWENSIKDKYNIVMTSTQANECSQHFYRKLGYFDIGGFTPPNESYELILLKNLK